MSPSARLLIEVIRRIGREKAQTLTTTELAAEAGIPYSTFYRILGEIGLTTERKARLHIPAEWQEPEDDQAQAT
jgi:predicted transcriptional regulator